MANHPGGKFIEENREYDPVTRPAMAAAPVVLFQNIPRINIGKYTRAE